MTAKLIIKTCIAFGVAMSGYAQGSLAPPGVPAPTMKALDQIEPATPITNLPYTISSPGAYYVAGPLSSASWGITIETNDVDLDLRGFTLVGPGAGAHGIVLNGSAASPRERVVIHNGGISKFQHGIQSEDASDCVFDGLVVRDVSKMGFQFKSSPAGILSGNEIRGCTISQVGSKGIYFASAGGARCLQNVIVDTLVVDAGGAGAEFLGAGGEVKGNRIAQCSFSFVGDEAIRLGTLSGGEISGNIIEECSIYNPGADAFLLSANAGTCNGNTIRRCTISHPGSLAGIQLVSSSGGECSGNLIEDNVVSEPDTFGILLLNTSVTAGNVIRNNLVDSGTNYGVRVEGATATRIENNHVHSATGAVSSVGIFTASAGSSDNLVIRNSSVGHNSNYALSGSDTYGPFITGNGALANTGQESHPSANFSQ